MQMGMPERHDRDKRDSGGILAMFRFLAGLMTVNRGLIIGAVVSCIVLNVCNIVAPIVVGRAIDSLSMPEQLLMSLAILGALYLLKALVGHGLGVMIPKIVHTSVYKVREKLYDKVLRLPVGYIDSHPHGDLMSRMTSDTEALTKTISESLPALISSVVMIGGCSWMLMAHSRELMLICLGASLLSLLLSSVMSRIIPAYVETQQKSIGDLNAHVNETMMQRKSILAYDRSEEVREQMHEKSEAMARNGIRAQIATSFLEPLMGILSNLALIASIVLCCKQIVDGTMTVGTMQMCLLFTRQLIKPISDIGQLVSQLRSASACCARIREIMDLPVEEQLEQVNVQNADIKGGLTFRNVNFSYVANRPVLSDLNLDIPAGQCIALVGSTGVGKTTLINLLLRFYKPDSGQILLNGIDIQQIELSRLYGLIAVILQDGALMSDTVANCISYGAPGATMEDIRAAAKQVHADEFIESLPDGYQTVLSQQGTMISPGQRQLICLARVVLMNPRIFVFDEATSYVDANTEQMVQNSLRMLRKDRTTIIIAHRLNTIKDADCIYLLENGQIKEQGKHEELLRNKGPYYHLYMADAQGDNES